MAFFFIESDILELQARGNSEHFFCESLRINVVFVSFLFFSLGTDDVFYVT